MDASALLHHLSSIHTEFCGANRTVTGSCHLIEINGKRILLDSGMYQGKRDVAHELNETLPNGAMDAVVLSHGHLDHWGKLSVLVKRGYTGPNHATPATVDVARIVLLNSAEIQEEVTVYRPPKEYPNFPVIKGRARWDNLIRSASACMPGCFKKELRPGLVGGATPPIPRPSS